MRAFNTRRPALRKIIKKFFRQKENNIGQKIGSDLSKTNDSNVTRDRREEIEVLCYKVSALQLE